MRRVRLTAEEVAHYLSDRDVLCHRRDRRIALPRPAAKDDQSKYARYRASKKRQGLKLVRLWLPDVNAPGFKEEAERQAAVLRGQPEEIETLAFMEALTLDWELEPYDWVRTGRRRARRHSTSRDQGIALKRGDGCTAGRLR
jgi:hypothetical protein